MCNVYFIINVFSHFYLDSFQKFIRCVKEMFMKFELQMYQHICLIFLLNLSALEDNKKRPFKNGESQTFVVSLFCS